MRKANLITVFYSLLWIGLTAQPINDDCSGIVDLGVVPVCDPTIYTNTGATSSVVFSSPSDNIPTCWNSVDHDVWLQFQVPADGSIVDLQLTLTGVTNGSNGALEQPEMAIYRGDCELEGLQELACISSLPGQTAVFLQLIGLTPGSFYYIRVDDNPPSASPSWGDFTLCIDTIPVPVLEATATPETLCVTEAGPPPVQLHVEGEGFSIFQWEPAWAVSDPSSSDPLGFTASAQDFIVTGYNIGANLILNGDFESGNTGFNSALGYVEPPTSGLCEGCYQVSDLPPSLWTQCPDHTGGAGVNQMVVNGATTLNQQVWCQTVPVIPFTDYLFSTWGQTLNSGNPAILAFSVNGAAIGNFNLPFFSCEWQQFNADWNSGTSTSAEICIVNQNTIGGGNDFALDDIAFSTVLIAMDTVHIELNSISGNVILISGVSCNGDCNGSASAQVVGGSGQYQYQWDNGETTPIATQLCEGEHFVQMTDLATGCSNMAPVLIPASDFDIEVVSLNDPCSANTSGTAQVLINGGVPPYEILWDNGETGETAENLSEGWHTVSVTDQGTCSAVDSVLITNNVNGFQVTINTLEDTICAGGNTQLNATGSPADFYTWSTGSGETSITVHPASTTTYTLTGFTVSNTNIIVNGDFETGSAGFDSDYIPGTGGPWGILSNEATFAIDDNPNDVHSNFSNCPDHTTGFGDMLIVNGAGQPNQNVWCQTINVVPNTTYQFSAWAMNVLNEVNVASLQFSINGQLLGNPFQTTQFACEWQEFFETWYSTTNTSALICIVNQNTTVGGNDFALDDISLRPVCISTDTIQITVSDPVLLADITAPTCGQSNGIVTGEATGGINPYLFSIDGGTQFQQSGVFEDLAPGSYTLLVNDAFGCAAVAQVILESSDNLLLNAVPTPTTCGLSNGSVIIGTQNGVGPFDYSIGNSVQNDPLFNELSPGDYTAEVTDAQGCSGIIGFNIAASQNIEVMIDTTAGTLLCDDISLPLSAGTFAAYQWSTGAITATIEADTAGIYSVTVTDAAGCEATVEVTLTQCVGAFEMPNAFSPNADDINDTFGPVQIGGGDISILEFKIYDRWGNVVHDQPAPWDGQYKGQPFPTEVLVYYIKIKLPGQEEVEMKGDLTLIR